MLFAGALASQEANQDPIDLAFLAAAKERHIFAGVPAITPISFAPFDATNRRTEAVVEQNGQRLRVMKGAVRAVAQACGLQPSTIEALEARVRAMEGSAPCCCGMLPGTLNSVQVEPASVLVAPPCLSPQ